MFVCEKRKIRLESLREKERGKLRNRRIERAAKHWQHTVVGFLHGGVCYTLVVISLTNNLPRGLSART